MKILQVNITGRLGSTGKIVNDIRDYLQTLGHEVIIAYGHSDFVDKTGFFLVDYPYESKIIAQFTKLGRARYKGNPLAFYRIKRLIEKFHPDVVHLHCLNGLICNNYKLFAYLADNKIKTVVTHHAEFFYTGSCAYSFDCLGYIESKCKNCPRPLYATSNRILCNTHKNWHRMYDAINKFDFKNIVFAAVSPWVLNRSLESPITGKYRGVVALNGVNQNIFHYVDAKRSFLNRVPNLKNHIVLHVSSQFSAHDFDGIKGGGYVTELAKMLPDCTFIVAASVVLDVQNIPSNMFIWGRTKDQKELALLYSLSDVTLITSRRETFSMIVAESLSCGTPVVGFKAGGPETIAMPKYSRFVDYADIETLKLAICNTIEIKYDKEHLSNMAISVYSMDKMGADYLKIYKDLVYQ